MPSAEFLLTSLVVVAIPGTGAIYTLSTGLLRGRRAALLAAFGCTISIAPHLLAAILGLFLLQRSAPLFQTIELAGVAYLLWLAWTMWREDGAFSAGGPAAPASARRIVVRAVLINLLNPKLTIFFFAFLPLFVPPGAASAATVMAALGGLFMALTLLVFALYGLLASAVQRRVAASPRAVAWTRRGFALLFAGLALRVALGE